MNRAGTLYAPDCGDFPATYPSILADAAERFLHFKPGACGSDCCPC